MEIRRIAEPLDIAIYESLQGAALWHFSDPQGIYDPPPPQRKEKKLRTPNLIPQNMQEAVKLRTQNKKDNPQILNLVMVKN